MARRNALLGSPSELHPWRSRAQSEVGLAVKQDDRLRAFEIQWSSRRLAVRAFRDAYGVDVESLRPEAPFAAELISGFVDDLGMG